MIGFFDSGFGGLTVLKSVVTMLPRYDYLYLGDNARVPYGSRSQEIIYEFTKQAVDFLFRQGCPLIIVACNTASANALRSVQQEYLPEMFPERRVLGVVRPSAEAIVERGYRTVGILATEGVVASGAYISELHKLNPATEIVQQACPLLVPIVESGEQEWDSTDVVVSSYVHRLFSQERNIDSILLACTHYPILFEKFRRHIPHGVAILEQGPIVAAKLGEYLKRHGDIERSITRGGTRVFFTTDRCERFDRLAQTFYGEPIASTLLPLECLSRFS